MGKCCWVAFSANCRPGATELPLNGAKQSNLVLAMGKGMWEHSWKWQCWGGGCGGCSWQEATFLQSPEPALHGFDGCGRCLCLVLPFPLCWGALHQRGFGFSSRKASGNGSAELRQIWTPGRSVCPVLSAVPVKTKSSKKNESPAPPPTPLLQAMQTGQCFVFKFSFNLQVVALFSSAQLPCEPEGPEPTGCSVRCRKQNWLLLAAHCLSAAVCGPVNAGCAAPNPPRPCRHYQ